MGRSSNQELIKSECGNYVLYKREGSGTTKYYARVRVPVTNEWKKYSTQTDDLSKAKRFAEKKLAEIEFRQEHNIPFDEKRFSDVADAAIDEMTKLIQAQTGKQSYVDYVRCLGKYKEFFGNKHIGRITSQDVVEFQNWLAAKLGRKPNKSTFNTYFAALKRVFDLAVRNRWVDQKLVPVIKNEGVKTKRRPDFEGKEIPTLRNFLAKYAETSTKTPQPGCNVSKGGVKNLSIDIRKFLFDYVDFILFTGIRPGREIKSLKWSHIAEEELDGEKKIVIRLPSGKTGPRTILAGNDIRYCLSRIAQRQLQNSLEQDKRGNQIKELYAALHAHEAEKEPSMQNGITPQTDIVVIPNTETVQPLTDIPFSSQLYKELLRSDVYLFRLPNGQFPKDLPGAFERALDCAKLLMNAQGQKRSLYSLRHTYATLMLVQNNVDIHTLARNMGTSVPMIEKHYSHLSVLQKHKQLSPLTEGIMTAAGFGDALQTIKEHL